MKMNHRAMRVAVIVLLTILQWSGVYAASLSCRDYVKDIEFFLGQGPDSIGSCRMETSGDYPPESVPYAEREGIENCYSNGSVAVEYLWRQGRRVKGTVHHWSGGKILLDYGDSKTVIGTVKVMKEEKLFCEVPVVENSLTGVVREFFSDGRLAEGFRLKKGIPEKGMVSFTPEGTLKQFECAEKPVFPGDKDRCGFSGKPATVTFVREAGSLKKTMTHLKGHLLEEINIHSNGSKEITRYSRSGSAMVSEEKYYPNGRLKSSLTRENNLIEGEAKEFYEDGHISVAAVFKKGVAEELHSYYQNGRPQLHAVVIRGEGSCKVSQYYRNGTPQKEGTYKTAYNGGVAWDTPHGKMRFYNDEGAIRREGNFNNGISEGVHTFFADSREKLEVEYKQGIPGVFRKFDSSGNPVSHGNIYEDGSVNETLKDFGRI